MLAQAANRRAAEWTRPFVIDVGKLHARYPAAQSESEQTLLDQLHDPVADATRAEVQAAYRLVIGELERHLRNGTPPRRSYGDGVAGFVERGLGLAGEPMRIPPPDPSSLDPAVAELLALAVAPSGETAQTVAVLAHSPALVGAFLGWAMALHSHGVLSARLHEIVALRVAHRCGSSYEWDEHTGWATAAGLTPAEIAAVADEDGRWSPTEAAAIAAVDELHETQNLTDSTLGTLRAHLSDAEVTELIVVVGQYTMLSMLASATGAATS